MALTNAASGVYAIAPTPFEDNGAIDFGSVDRLVAFYEQVNVDGLVLLGKMGEAPKLDHDESVAIVKRVLSRTSLPVVVGVTAPGYAAMRSLAGEVMDAGAAGVMVGPPMTLRTDDQIVSYYEGVVHEIGAQTPLVVQDYPLVFSVVMSPEVIRRMASSFESFVVLKHEDWPGLAKITRLREFEEAGTMPHLSILCGNGGLFLDFETERGANGAMTGYCFPEMLVDVVNQHKEKSREEVHDIFDAHLPLVRYEQQQGIGLAVRKYVFHRRGVLASAAQRRPGADLGSRATAEVEFLLSRLARKDARARF
jgi:4-hydroxy-tetrahydrodipicolinate synthase